MTIQEKLIKHYQCFNTERFYIDEHIPKEGFISIVTSSINDTCPEKLCKNIAKFTYRNLEHKENYKFIYIGAWIFETKNF